MATHTTPTYSPVSPIASGLTLHAYMSQIGSYGVLWLSPKAPFTVVKVEVVLSGIFSQQRMRVRQYLGGSGVLGK